VASDVELPLAGIVEGERDTVTPLWGAVGYVAFSV
jgi:hypothetical protein